MPCSDGDFVQVVIVGHDLAVVALGQLDEFQVHVRDIRKIVVRDFDFEVRHLLNALQHFEAAAPALALHRVGGIGHQLQFAQDELRDQQDAVEEVRFADVRDAPVDDHAGIEHLGHAPGAALAAEQASQGLQIQHVALVRADDQADIGHHQEQPDVQERPRALRNGGARQNQAHQIRAQDAEDRAHRRADQPPHAGALQANLKQEDRNRKRQALCPQPPTSTARTGGNGNRQPRTRRKK